MANELFVFPTSFAQQRLWILDQMMPGGSFYNVSNVTRLSLPVNQAFLKQAVNEIVRRHETLRTTFRNIDGKPFQVVSSELELDLPLHNLTSLSPAEQEIAVKELANNNAIHPFDLSEGPLVRISLIELDVNDYFFLIAIHHIISDAWSLEIFFRELPILYDAFFAGKPSPLPELPIQYADFAVWQREYLKDEVLDKQMGYWKQQLSDLPQLLLPLDKSRPPFQTFRGKTEKVELSGELSDQLRKLSQKENATLFMTLLSGFIALLYRYTDQEDIVIGAPIAGRNQTELEGLIGFFVNSLVIRTQLSGNLSFKSLLQRVRTVVLEAFAHAEIPFEKLVEELHPERDLSRNPLFQVLFQLLSGKDNVESVSATDSNIVDVNANVSKFDLTLFMSDSTGALSGTLEYNTDLFFPETIRRIISHYRNLLLHVVNKPEVLISDIELFDSSEKELLLHTWNAGAKAYPTHQLVHRLIHERALVSPGNIALFTEHGQISYADLDIQTNQFAHYLIAKGIRPESLVVAFMKRSEKMVIAHLAILKAGGAFVPLDPAYPRERLEFMLSDTQASFVITEDESLEYLPVVIGKTINLDAEWEEIVLQPSSLPEVFLSPFNRAYVIFTSGSTGRPKGVEISHAGLLNMVNWNVDTYQISAADRCLQTSTPTFDAYIYELFPCLVAGASAYLVDDITRTSSVQLKHKIYENKITICCLTTSLAEALLEHPFDGDTSLRILATAGEKLMRLPTWKPHFFMFNLYGPTENTVIATFSPVSFENKDSFPPIGRPVANVSVYIVDQNMNPVAIGVPGELYIGGEGLARGYLNRPALTAEKFVPNPFSDIPGSRLYKTGDLVKYLPNGEIDFLGRIDHQVKLRGFRIELDEIEKVLHENSSVREAVAVLKEITPGNTGIITFVSGRPGTSITAENLRQYLKEKLPSFMIPAHISIVDEIPKASSGKVNRSMLRGPDFMVTNTNKVQNGASSEMEKIIRNIWKEVLGVEDLGAEENFFDIGGHSMMMAQVHHKLIEKLGFDVSLIKLFQFPNIRQLAKYLEDISVRAVSD